MKNNHLALGGLFCALHLLFIFMSKIIVGSELLLVVFLPLLSTIYTLKFNIKESAVFSIATFFLCVIFEPISTCIYVLPAILCGMVYGVARKKGLKELSIVYVSSLVHALSVTISFLFVVLMFKGIDFFSLFSNFINKSGEELYVCIYLILLLVGVMESFITHIIANEELKKLGYKEVEKEICTPMWINICLIVSVCAYIVLAFIKPLYSCYCLPFVIAFLVPNVIEFMVNNKHKWVYLLSGFIFVGIVFVFNYVNAIFYPALLMSIFLPMVLKNFVGVLYTNQIKYSNKCGNRIK